MKYIILTIVTSILLSGCGLKKPLEMPKNIATIQTNRYPNYHINA
jgi:predicted small lipoprotein YifL